MDFLCGPTTQGPQELGGSGPGSLNRLNLRFLRHCKLTQHIRKNISCSCRSVDFSTEATFMQEKAAKFPATNRPRLVCSRHCGQVSEPSSCGPDTALPLAQTDASAACIQQTETL